MDLLASLAPLIFLGSLVVGLLLFWLWLYHSELLRRATESALAVRRAQRDLDLNTQHHMSDWEARHEMRKSIEWAEKIPAWLRRFYLAHAVNKLEAEDAAEGERVDLARELVERMKRHRAKRKTCAPT